MNHSLLQVPNTYLSAPLHEIQSTSSLTERQIGILIKEGRQCLLECCPTCNTREHVEYQDFISNGCVQGDIHCNNCHSDFFLDAQLQHLHQELINGNEACAPNFWQQFTKYVRWTYANRCYKTLESTDDSLDDY